MFGVEVDLGQIVAGGLTAGIDDDGDLVAVGAVDDLVQPEHRRAEHAGRTPLRLQCRGWPRRALSARRDRRSPPTRRSIASSVQDSGSSGGPLGVAWLRVLGASTVHGTGDRRGRRHAAGEPWTGDDRDRLRRSRVLGGEPGGDPRRRSRVLLAPTPHRLGAVEHVAQGQAAARRHPGRVALLDLDASGADLDLHRCPVHARRGPSSAARATARAAHPAHPGFRSRPGAWCAAPRSGPGRRGRSPCSPAVPSS